MALRDLDYTVVYVDNLEGAQDFYSNKLGLKVSFAAPGWIQFDTNGAALVLHPRTAAKPDGRGTATHLAFRVDDLEKEYDSLTKEGVEFRAPPSTAGFGKHATLVDLEGNEIDLIEWNARLEIQVTSDSVTNDIINGHPETMEVFEEHGIRICGGCLVLLNSPVHQTADYSGLDSAEATRLVEELNEKLTELSAGPGSTQSA